MKVSVPHFTTIFDFYCTKYSFANYSFAEILLHILQFPQNTENVRLSYAKYSMTCCTNYSFSEILLRDIQEFCCAKYSFVQKLLRKIQDWILRLVYANYRCCANYNKPYSYLVFICHQIFTQISFISFVISFGKI